MKKIVHCRFYKKKRVSKSELFDKIITIKWDYDIKNQILRYGATVYHKSNKFWNKRDHKNTACNRFDNNPVIIDMIIETDRSSIDNDIKLSIDDLISTNLIYKFGACKRIADLDETTNFKKNDNERVLKKWIKKETKKIKLEGRGKKEEKENRFDEKTLAGILTLFGIAFFVMTKLTF